MDWMDIPIFEYIGVFSVYNYKVKGTDDAFKFQCLPANRSLFPPLGNLTPQDAESELKLPAVACPLTDCMGPYVLYL